MDRTIRHSYLYEKSTWQTDLKGTDSSNGTDIKAQELVQGGEILDRFSAESPIFTLCIFGQLLTSIIDGRWLTTA
ncbi:hypothetical protein CLAFUW4_12638 [Fulvia fulva]|uniref:Uncharacterized protein n=1 Tax=Passalora fulva TaxID=5499 RepID=A0A9Q8USD2_PASFU|nr:uncharacterized protein CLAFUR5_11661 [Fulvia fulva]KAK4617528.1 hypothetical protein CLAFUR4_12643 [Fulvia fulva]KAK4618896.1 hypothetical protein CLAFUR0_12654 [Fulvia fulva]UJO20678.1 hypothetical protein CLAFUR5_11661 [Fulvia fulva]WPV18003.1 hypothetical protein CLAFUW4_12638 [Fulvia fulva]WPV32958.1 hypothetical protein CLAFUW7_12645 [Fulvia fulva]